MINTEREYVIELFEAVSFSLKPRATWSREVLWEGRDRATALSRLASLRKRHGDNQVVKDQRVGQSLKRVVLNVYCDGDERKPYEKGEPDEH